jgi:hypothetical protein
MSKGYLIYATDAKIKKYTRCAYALALSIKNQMPSANISLVTDDDIPKKYNLLFDNVIEIPWKNKNLMNSTLKVEDRWKLYHCTPYDETIILDSDMLVLSDIDHWWDHLKTFDVFLTSEVNTYRGNVAKGRYYRKAFDSNNIPNYYFGLCYFKKNEIAKNYFKWIEDITKNWELFYGKFVSLNYPKFPSMDITCGLTAKILDCVVETSEKNSMITFTHMKPMIQEWESPTDSWQDSVGVYVNEACHLKIGNYQQSGIFHYTEYSFLNVYIVNQLEKILGLS